MAEPLTPEEEREYRIAHGGPHGPFCVACTLLATLDAERALHLASEPVPATGNPCPVTGCNALNLHYHGRMQYGSATENPEGIDQKRLDKALSEHIEAQPTDWVWDEENEYEENHRCSSYCSTDIANRYDKGASL